MGIKRLLHIITALTAAFFAAACASTAGEEAVLSVPFSVSLSHTRALADGSAIDHVWCCAYLDGVLAASAEAEMTGGQAEVVLELANNRSYDVVIWAAKYGNALWSFNPSTAVVTADYAWQASSSDEHDAFWYRGTVTAAGAQSKDVILTRAVAQIWLGTVSPFVSVEDLTLTVSGVPSSWNMLTDSLDGVSDVVLNLDGSAPAETFTAGSEVCYLVGMASLLSPAAETAANISFSMTKDGTPVSRDIANSSIRRNWCTKIAGNF